MKSKRLIAFFRFFYDFLEICIRNILHLAFIEHRHQFTTTLSEETRLTL